MTNAQRLITNDQFRPLSHQGVAGEIACAAMFLSLLGCGPRIVDPGRSVGVVPPTSVQPAAPAGLPTLEAPEIQQVPAESILQFPAEPESSTYHSVQSGETLTSVAKKYGVRVEQLRSSNGLDSSTSLQPKQLLFIPKGG